MSDLYRKIEGPTDDLEGDWFGMVYEVDGKTIEVAFVPVTIDYEAAARSFTANRHLRLDDRLNARWIVDAATRKAADDA